MPKLHLKEGVPMQNSSVVMKDMRESISYLEKAKPIISKMLNGGTITPVEGDDNEICKMLDRTCGTDYFQVYEDKGIVWGIASRFQKIQNGYRPYNTFTVRKSRESGAQTEYEKRKNAIKCNGVYPYLTLQAFVNSETKDILSLAIAKTSDIIDYIENGYAEEKHTGFFQIGQASFYVLQWGDMQKKGYKVLAYLNY